MTLQRLAGNGAVSRLLSGAGPLVVQRFYGEDPNGSRQVELDFSFPNVLAGSAATRIASHNKPQKKKISYSEFDDKPDMSRWRVSPNDPYTGWIIYTLYAPRTPTGFADEHYPQ